MQIKEDDAKDLPRGTRITLHLKEDAKDLADAQKLSNLIKQYSEFIQFPIKLWQSKTEYDQVRPCPGVHGNTEHLLSVAVPKTQTTAKGFCLSSLLLEMSHAFRHPDIRLD